MYYMRHRSSIKRRSKARYRRVHHSGTFRRLQKHRRLHPNQHRRIHASTSLSLPAWTLTLGDITVVGVCCEDVQFTVEAVPDEVHGMNYLEFLAEVVFLDEGDIDALFMALDTEMGLDPVQELESDQEEGAIE